MLTYIDLFCGAGGFSKGFDDEGYVNVFSVEYDKEIAKTYEYNFKNHTLICDDIRNISTKQIMEHISKFKEIDVIVGGSPCQGFSKAGNPGRTFIDDERNYLFKEYIRILSVVKPKTFIFENVAALENHRRGQSLNEIISSFKNEGYTVQYRIMNTAEYGIPQERRRIIVVGVRNDISKRFEFPKKDNEVVTIKDAIGDLPALKSGEKSSIPNHNAMKHSEQMLKKMSYVKDGGDRSQIPLEIRPTSGDARKYIRYNSQKPSVCVTGDMRKIFHYEQNRALTARELARLQTFPDDFTFIGNSICIQQQIGNAVPPLLAKKLANQIKKVLDA